MIPAILLFAVAVLYRIAIAYVGGGGWAMNFAPLAAIALCGPSLFPRRIALALPLAILLASDLVLNWHYGAALATGEMLTRYAALLAIAFVGLRLSGRAGVTKFALASLVSSTGFYLLTNTASWLTAPEYAKTAAGWWQALTIGITGFPPTWTFFRSTLVSDMLFTMLFIGCLALGRKLAEPALPNERPARLGHSS